MQFTQPIPFEEALTKLGRRSAVGAALSSAQWSRVPTALRERAFFSAGVENVRFLQRAQDALDEFLAGAREDTPGGPALKVGSRAAFIAQMREFALAEGMGPLAPEDKGTLKDITAEKRLGLIFDVQTQAAYDYGNWQQGMDPDVLAEFPAQRFIREVEVEKPRAVHAAHEGAVRLKTDLEFWLAMNSPEFGGFGVPWGPWGFNSGMGVEDVDRAEAEALGLLAPGLNPQPADRDLNEHLQASVGGLSEGALDWLRRSFGDNVTFDGDKVRWVRQPNAHEHELARPARPDGGREAGVGGNDARGIAGVARGLFARDESGDDAVPVGGSPFAEGQGASVAAVAAGRKRLFHDEAHDPVSLVRGLRAVLPREVAVETVGRHVYAYRPAEMESWLRERATKYPGFSPLDQIHRATLQGRNGLMLGYGQERMNLPGSVVVVIRNPAGQVVFGFHAPAAGARTLAAERQRDFTAAYGPGYTVELQPLN